MKAVIELDVPEWQIGQPVSVYFPDTMQKKGTCELLKEQDAETKRILKIIWDTLHEGLSIDTVPDQDWVYEQIRNRIEGTYDET